MNNAPIYLDGHSTTRLDPRVFDAMKPAFLQHYGNPSQNLHAYNWSARALLDQARSQVAFEIGCDSSEIIFTSGASEANHLALLGLQLERKKILTLAIEHSSVLNPLKELQKKGYEVQMIPLEKDGRVNLSALKVLLDENVGLVSIAWANHEVGTVQDMLSIAALCKQNGTILHSDVAQAGGHLKINVRDVPVDLITFSAHKMHGPKGVGALYVRRNVAHSRTRSGTAAVPLIIGFSTALSLAAVDRVLETKRVSELRDLLWSSLSAGIPGLLRNGCIESALPHHLNVSIPQIDGSALFARLKGVAVSNASSCLSGLQDYSQVLTELGVGRDMARASLRFGLGRFTTEEEILRASVEIIAVVKDLTGVYERFFGIKNTHSGANTEGKNYE